MLQLAFAPIMEVELKRFVIFVIAKSVHNSSQFFSFDPWINGKHPPKLPMANRSASTSLLEIR